MTTWNTRSMTKERYTYCKGMGYGVLAVTEFWRNQDNFTEYSNEFIVSVTIKDENGELVNKEDPAVGVGIILSPRAQRNVMAKGNNNSERIF